MTDIAFADLLNLVDQLPSEQQIALMEHLEQRTKQGALSVDEKMRLLRSAQIDVEVNQEPSTRRQDWYDDDGR